jgi:hypothetical protein
MRISHSTGLGALSLTLAAFISGCASMNVNPATGPAPAMERVAADAQARGMVFLRVVPNYLVARILGKTSDLSSNGNANRSWISSKAAAQNLLYVSDAGQSEVRVYSYPKGQLTGELTNLSQPSGVCADSSGAIWVVESGARKLLKYLHGAKKPAATLSADGAQNLFGCSVDPTTGDLAVTDLGGPGGVGGVWIYTGAKGTPKLHKDSHIASYYFCGYDKHGNLFVDGVDKSYAFRLLELPSGGSSFQLIVLKQSVNSPGGIQWDGQYVAIGDQLYKGKHQSAVFEFTISGAKGTLEGTTPLAGCDILQFAITTGTNRQIIGPDTCRNDVGIYKYPAGGDPVQELKDVPYPVAAAVSPAG